jgi:hypothetical protein
MIITRHKVHHTPTNSMFADQRMTPNAITERCKDIPFGVDTDIKERSFELNPKIKNVRSKAKRRNEK